MKRLNLYCMALAVLAIFSCAREQEVLVPESESGMKFTAVWSDEASRTSLDENGTSVLWGPGDEIFIFQGVTTEGPSAMGKFTSTNTARQSTATFTGSLEGECSGDYIAVYPYYQFHELGTAMDASEYGTGSVVVHMIDPVQHGVEGSFDTRTAPAAAISSTNELVFYNICGGVRFSVAQSGVKKVTFSSIDGSPMSGSAIIVTDEDGLPMAMMSGIFGSGETEEAVNNAFVDVIAPEGGFVPGKNYYALMAPQTYTEGIKITLYGDGVKAERVLSGPITVKRSVFGRLDNIDAGLEYVSKTPVPEVVDLGLSVKWASCNLGATKPEEYGDYFAWGETDTKSHFTPSNYKWLVGGNFTRKYTLAQSMYNVDSQDNKLVLDPEDDAAHLNLGGKWRMPTAEEFEELASGCTWTEETVNGVQGVRVTSNVSGYADRSIFIPYAGGRDDYNSGMDPSSMNLLWSASNYVYPDPESYYAGLVCTAFYSGLGMCDFGFRYWGLPVRPVYAGEVVHVTGVALNESGLQIYKGETAQLTATITPEDASNKRVVWTSSDDSIATVSEDGVVIGVFVGTAEITATTLDGEFSATCTIEVNYRCETPEMVDLGLPSGIKWASFNLGATKPEEYGEYFTWGETEPIGKNYTALQYKWLKDNNIEKFTKYNDEDNNIILDTGDDAAFVNLGTSWRMPTDTDWMELGENCTWKWGEVNGVYGYKIVSNVSGYTDQWIFLPAASSSDEPQNKVGSYGHYWSSSRQDSYSAWDVRFSAENLENHYDWWRNNARRYYGLSVRPVYDGGTGQGVTLNKKDLRLPIRSMAMLVATARLNEAADNEVTWKSSHSSVATVTSYDKLKCVITAIGVGTSEITATSLDGSVVATCPVQVTTYEAATPDVVDLGLSVKWANFNLGASSSDEWGCCFAWGETKPKVEYTLDNYMWATTAWWIPSKYNLSDGKTVLEPEDDAATMGIGGNWRTPTFEEWKELCDYCSMGTRTINGVKGLKITSRVYGYTDKWIFLPECYTYGGYGSCCYWSSTRRMREVSDSDVSYAHYFELHNHSTYLSTLYRWNGLSVRPVYDTGVRVTGVSLNESSIQMRNGQTVQLQANVIPADASSNSVVWTSSNEYVAKVSPEGLVTALTMGTSEIVATTADGHFTASCMVEVLPEIPEMVDLGLSVKWASFNLGSSAPEEYGSHFAWGETEPKTEYTWINYKFRTSGNSYDTVKFSKYNTQSSYGPIDNKAILDPEDDAASVALGGSWRMPTYEEWEELKTNCSCTWTTLNGVYGRKIISKISGYTDQWIFLPAAGELNGNSFSNGNGYYWSSSSSFYPYNARGLFLSSTDFRTDSAYRYRGRSIRPVFSE